MAEDLEAYVQVLPAYAGMIPFEVPQMTAHSCAPRVCGDDPVAIAHMADGKMCSPRMRG